MTRSKYITNNGVLRPDTTEIIKEVTEEYKSILGLDNELDESSTEGRLIDAEITARINTIEACAFVANQLNPDIAQGIFLDAICSLTGVYRQTATKSIAVCTLKGVNGTLIPIGSIVSDKVNQWQSIEQGIIDNKEVKITFECLKEGAITAQAGEIDSIITVIDGWDSVTNENNAIIGRDSQTDNELKSSRIRKIGSNGASNSCAIISQVSKVTGVIGVSYRENVANEKKTIDFVDMEPHSTYICVDGGSDNAIAEAYQVKKAGSTTVGKVTVKYKDEYSGQTIDIKFDRPTLKPIKTQVTVLKESTTSSMQAIKQVIIDYTLSDDNAVNGFKLGNQTTIFEITEALVNGIKGIKVTSCKLAEKTGNLSCDPIENKIFEKSTLNISDIEVILK